MAEKFEFVRTEDTDERFLLRNEDVSAEVQKYFRRKLALFRYFNEGIYMTHELLFSVTPEAVAVFIAKFVKSCNPNIKTVLDVFCGGGGNTIQFGKYFEKAIGVDISEDNLTCTARNCQVYQVDQHVELYKCDWSMASVDQDFYSNDLFTKNRIDFIFASPPWGGPSYGALETFDLDHLLPLKLEELLKSFFRVTSNVGLFLPKNSNVEQISSVTKKLLGDDAVCRIIYTKQSGHVKAMTVFWGDCFMPQNYGNYEN